MSASVELLKAARAKIADPANWTRGCLARGPAGAGAVFSSPHACAWCAVGALYSAAYRSRQNSNDSFDLLLVTSRDLFGEDIVTVNDRLGHICVLEVYDTAIAKAEASNA